MRRYLLISILLAIAIGIHANCYWLSLRDKAGTAGNLQHPETFLSERALQNREHFGIETDSLDLPVSSLYLDSLRRIGAEVLHTSRWLNGVTVRVTTQEVLSALQETDFITSIQLTEDTLYENSVLPDLLPNKSLLLPDSIDYGKATTQVELLQLPPLHNEGFTGKDILIAVADDGFYRLNELTSLSNAYEHTLFTKDFVTTGGDVYEQGTHGSMVMSCIAAQTTDISGTAPDASFILMRTEYDTYENYREMDNLVAAFELADSLGADVMSVSLGYLNLFDSPDMILSYADMDGRTSRCSQAATIAARKGLLICCAAGNEGNKDWHYICTPGDADSILTIGAVTAERSHSSFSSYGPTADGRIKPDLCAMGTNCSVIDPTTDAPRNGNGTSFATPIMAGAVACLRQALPEMSNMDIIRLLKAHASQTDSPDNTLGYGIPNIYEAYLSTQTSTDYISGQYITQPYTVYSLQGYVLGNSIEQLPAGIYLIHSGTQIIKIVKSNE